MEETPLNPSVARVLRIKPGPDERPAKGFTWGDYEEYAGQDDGTSADGDEDDTWEQVKSKKKSRTFLSALPSLSLSLLPVSSVH